MRKNKKETIVGNDPFTPLLVDASAAATLLGVGRSHFYALHSSGRLGPMPIALGRRKLWRVEELREWVRQGCPSRDKWAVISRKDA